MYLFAVFVFFVTGLVVGSFLNVVVYRLKKNEGVVRGRSYCPSCNHTLAWYDLIPLLSFLLLGGRCRHCKARISPQYPAVEFVTALLFSAIFYTFFQSPVEIFYLLIVGSALIVLFVYDLKHYILPDKVIFPAVGFVLSYRIFEAVELQSVSMLMGAGTAVLLAVGFFLSLFLASRGRVMGFGDVKLAAFMGLFLGWPNIVVALFTAFMLGGVVGVVLIVLKKKGMKSEVPFGPFLITGTCVAVFFGQWIVDWYLRLVLV